MVFWIFLSVVLLMSRDNYIYKLRKVLQKKMNLILLSMPLLKILPVHSLIVMVMVISIFLLVLVVTIIPPEAWNLKTGYTEMMAKAILNSIQKLSQEAE